MRERTTALSPFIAASATSDRPAPSVKPVMRRNSSAESPTRMLRVIKISRVDKNEHPYFTANTVSGQHWHVKPGASDTILLLADQLTCSFLVRGENAHTSFPLIGRIRG